MKVIDSVIACGNLIELNYLSKMCVYRCVCERGVEVAANKHRLAFTLHVTVRGKTERELPG